MAKVKIGFLQEFQSDGTISNSFMRLLEALFFILLCAYVYLSSHSYETHFQEYVKLLTSKCISEQSFNMLTSQLKRIDWDIFAILVIASVVPKAIQKFAEVKTGIKDTSESTTSTTTTDKTSTTS
jgi:hypothetical protein